MFSQSPGEQSQSKTIKKNSRRLRKKKNFNKNKKKKALRRKQSRFQVSMSSWADNYITAVTWQMKHQIAYWKSKARALEYENKILHEIIRNKSTSTTVNDFKSDTPTESSASDLDDEEDNDDSDNVEVSEEFIQFLIENAKFKEEARKERERLNTKLTEIENEKMEESATEVNESCVDNLKELYGKAWQRISATEMVMQCEYIEKLDNCSPLYWPNIPLNFSYI